VTQAEALLRWQHPERGLLPPSELLPVAEGSGLIVPIGRWVLHTACDAALRWDGVAVAVNVSFRELVEPTFRATVGEVLTRTGIAPHLLTLELTEQVCTGDLDEVHERLDQLAALGVRLAVHVIQASAVRALGCTAAQGFHFAEAMPVEGLAAFLDVQAAQAGVPTTNRR
jgi:EAL domain-containing protein (putative c-di-GMP-specific phosphodiesterase class I)